MALPRCVSAMIADVEDFDGLHRTRTQSLIEFTLEQGGRWTGSEADEAHRIIAMANLSWEQATTMWLLSILLFR